MRPRLILLNARGFLTVPVPGPATGTVAQPVTAFAHRRLMWRGSIEIRPIARED